MRSETLPRHRRIHYLDFARFFAAIIVALYHYNLKPPHPSEGPLHFGHLGVQFFFIISGFVIARSAQGSAPGPFLVKRFIRLAPTLWASVLILGLIKLAMGHHADNPVGVWDIFGNLTFLSLSPFAKLLHCDHLVVQPLWTLGFEIYFYILIALAGLFKRGRQIFMYCWVTIAMLETLRGGPVSPLEHFVRQLTMFEAAPFFAGGYFLSKLYEEKKLNLVNIGFCFICFFLSIRHSYELSSQMIGWKAPWSAVPDTNVIGAALVASFWIFFLIVIYVKSDRDEQPSKTLKLELILGAASYPIYLFHPLMNSYIERLSHILHFKLLAMASACVVIIVVAILEVRYLENPLQRWLTAKLLPKRSVLKSTEQLVQTP